MSYDDGVRWVLATTLFMTTACSLIVEDEPEVRIPETALDGRKNLLAAESGGTLTAVTDHPLIVEVPVGFQVAVTVYKLPPSNGPVVPWGFLPGDWTVESFDTETESQTLRAIGEGGRATGYVSFDQMGTGRIEVIVNEDA